MAREPAKPPCEECNGEKWVWKNPDDPFCDETTDCDCINR